MSAIPKASKRMSRRGFLILLGTGAAGLFLGLRLAAPTVRLRLVDWVEESGGPPSRVEGPPDAWFNILPDNTVRLFLPKSEMGQGVHTGLAQIAAEELELEWEQLGVLHAGTGQGLDDPVGTSASNSISSLFVPLREAAATLRELLRGEAAKRLNLPVEQITAEGGRMVPTGDAARALTYGELFTSAAEWELPETPPALKAESSFRYIGKSQPRVDLPEKITGRAVYGYDVRLPEMLYGAVARPRTIEGRLRSVKPGEATNAPGVVKVVIEDGFAGVVANSRVEAYNALEKLDLQWDDGKLWQQAEIDALVMVGNGEGVVIQKEGDAAGALDAPDALKDGSLVEAEYRTPMAYHAYLEPLSAAADVQADSVQVWASTQAAVRLRSKIAEAMGREEETITVTPVYLGGGLGRKIDETAAVDAARLSAAAGKPVHLGMLRPQDFRSGFVRPSTHHIFHGRLNPDGSLLAIEHLQASGAVAFPFMPAFLGAVMGADFGSWRGAILPYAAPNVRTVAWLADVPVSTGWWRGLGLFANTFAVESFIDEMAYAAGADPLEFRLKHLPQDEKGERMRKALQTAAQAAGWGSPPPGRGLGLASCYDYGTVVAEVAEVSVEGSAIRVHKVTAAVDPGLIINPNAVEAQTMGAITMGVSSALLEEVTVQDGVLQPANFDAYSVLRNADAPEIEVITMQSGSKPYGMGEPPIGPSAAAVSNAVFALTGKRLRTLPLRL